ncbi:MAG: hypothetical protein AB7H93_08215 [Vicinamibacterales bacterium]
MSRARHPLGIDRLRAPRAGVRWNAVCNGSARVRSTMVIAGWGLAMWQLLLAGSPAWAQEPHHRAGGEIAGQPVRFATTCRPTVAGVLDRGVHQLHTLALDDAIETFRLAAHSDVDCRMAYWGTAMAHWARFSRSADPNTLAAGWQALDQAALLHRPASPREQRFLEAVHLRFRHRLVDGPRRYAAAMTALADAFPADPHAVWFAAAARLEQPVNTAAEATAAGHDALALLDRPTVPAGHVVTGFYKLVAGDTPALAHRVAELARALADDPDLPARLLRAPQQIFARLGRWADAIAIGERSVDGARRVGAAGDELLALDGLVLAQLQAGRIDEARAIARRLDGGYLAHASGVDVQAARARIAARILLDTDDTTAAAALALPDDAAPTALAPRLFARVLGAAALGRGDDAAAGARRLDGIAARPGTAPETTRLARAAGAWAAMAAARADDALAQLRAVADEEDHAVDGGLRMPLRPAREQLADLLRLLRRDGEAAATYRQTLARWPGRRRASTALEAQGRDRRVD